MDWYIDNFANQIAEVKEAHSSAELLRDISDVLKAAGKQSPDPGRFHLSSSSIGEASVEDATYEEIIAARVTFFLRSMTMPLSEITLHPDEWHPAPRLPDSGRLSYSRHWSGLPSHLMIACSAIVGNEYPPSIQTGKVNCTITKL